MIDQLVDRVPAPREHVLAAERSGRPARSTNRSSRPRRPRRSSLMRYLFINGSRFDLVDDNKPFVGTAPMPPGHALYPADLTHKDIDAYVAAHPDKKAAHLRPLHRRASRRAPSSRARKYHDEFQPFVGQAADALQRGRRTLRRSGVRRVPAPARRRAAERRLLRERHRVARAEGSEVRRDLRALRNVSRRSARRENVVRRVDPDPQRGREPTSSRSISSGCRTSRTRCRSPRRIGRRCAATRRRWK